MDPRASLGKASGGIPVSLQSIDEGLKKLSTPLSPTGESHPWFPWESLTSALLEDASLDPSASLGRVSGS